MDKILVSRLVVMLLILVQATGSQAQDVGAYDDGTRYKYRHDVIALSISPLNLLDYHNGSAYRSGVTIYPHEEIRFTADLGGYWPALSSTMTGFDNFRGFNFRGTVGYGGSQYDMYGSGGSIGAEYAYRKRDFNYTGSDLNNVSYTANISSFAHFFGAYVSFISFFSDRWNLESRVSAGLRYQEIDNNQNHLLTVPEGAFDKMRYRQMVDGINYRPYIHVGFRLSYVLWQVN